MNTKQFEAHLMSLIKKFVPILLLQRHTFEVAPIGKDRTGYFECLFNYPYLNVKIFYSQKALDDWKSGSSMEPYVVHEMCHVVTDPLYAKSTSRFVTKDEIEDERERLTDHLCNIALKIL